MCLNPHDPESMRIYSTSGCYRTLDSNNGAGMTRDGILVCADNRVPSTSNSHAGRDCLIGYCKCKEKTRGAYRG